MEVVSEASAGRLDRVWAATAAAGAAVLGAAPHVLHHVGPLTGAVLVSGATGSVLFAVVGFALAIPLLIKLHRRHGSWLAPALAAGLMAVAFVFSTVVLGPLIAGDQNAAPATDGGATGPTHEAHHE